MLHHRLSTLLFAVAGLCGLTLSPASAAVRAYELQPATASGDFNAPSYALFDPVHDLSCADDWRAPFGKADEPPAP